MKKILKFSQAKCEANSLISFDTNAEITLLLYFKHHPNFGNSPE
jgi:hypothetical protein